MSESMQNKLQAAKQYLRDIGGARPSVLSRCMAGNETKCMKRIYIAGPMTGLPDNNYPAFHAEAARLRASGFVVENPAENPDPECKSWAGYMRLALPQLCKCDAVVLLEGWESSKGAVLEYHVAQQLGIQIMGDR